MRRSALACLAALLLPAAAAAHKPSDSYLTLRARGSEVAGRWDVALRDLDAVLGLDGDGDGRITWGELREHSAAVSAYAFASLDLAADGVRCAIRPGAQQVERHSDGAYAVLWFASSCASAPSQLAVEYTLLAGVDPQHRGLLRLEHAGASQSAVLGGSEGTQRFSLSAPAPGRTLLRYVQQGVWHIATGFDHLLFLLCLLLPAVLRREAGRWAPAASLRAVALDVARVVSAFTAAHSLTLSLAVLGFVTLPARWVESAIAASVVLAALNNLYPLVDGRRWAVAFGFGLLHGFGFASVLDGLGLPTATLAPALLGFNLGVELGQLVGVALFLPLAFALRERSAYRGVALRFGSAAIAAIALVWLIERGAGLTL